MLSLISGYQFLEFGILEFGSEVFFFWVSFGDKTFWFQVSFLSRLFVVVFKILFGVLVCFLFFGEFCLCWKFFFYELVIVIQRIVVKIRGQDRWFRVVFFSESVRVEINLGICLYLFFDLRAINQVSERGWFFSQFLFRVFIFVFCGVIDSCFKYFLRYIWKRDVYRSYLFCFVIIYCVIYFIVFLFFGEMQFFGEKQSFFVILQRFNVGGLGRVEVADSLNKI